MQNLCSLLNVNIICETMIKETGYNIISAMTLTRKWYDCSHYSHYSHYSLKRHRLNVIEQRNKYSRYLDRCSRYVEKILVKIRWTNFNSPRIARYQFSVKLHIIRILSHPRSDAALCICVIISPERSAMNFPSPALFVFFFFSHFLVQTRKRKTRPLMAWFNSIAA